MFACSFILKKADANSPAAAGNLHASELAYLMRPGDSTHCLIVLAVDYLQKLLKLPNTQLAASDSPEYEKELVGALKAYISDWSKQRALDMVPELKSKNPVRLVSGVLRIKMWLAENLKALHLEITKDPMSIRRYFAPSGIIRAVFSIAASSARLQLEQSLRERLTEQKLLLSEEERKHLSTQISSIAAIYLLVMTLLCSFFPAVAPAGAKITLFFGAACCGVVLRLICSLPYLLPFLEELSLVLDSVTRKGIRLKLMRTILKAARTVFWIAVLAFFTAALLLQSFLLRQIYMVNAEMWILNFVAYLGIALNFALITHLFMLAYKIHSTPQLSATGRLVLSKMHDKLRHKKLIDICSELLTKDCYSEDLSLMVAVYGIETLFFLA